MLDFLLAASAVLALAALLPALAASYSLAPWHPGRVRDAARIAGVGKLDDATLVYELGSGDGRMAAAIAAASGARVVGIELAWVLHLAARARSKPARGSASFLRGDIFKTDLSVPDVVYVYGMPAKLTSLLAPKLQRELKPGARIISYNFPVAGWTAEATDRGLPGDYPVHVYRAPDAWERNPNSNLVPSEGIEPS